MISGRTIRESKKGDRHWSERNAIGETKDKIEENESKRNYESRGRTPYIEQSREIKSERNGTANGIEATIAVDSLIFRQ